MQKPDLGISPIAATEPGFPLCGWQDHKREYLNNNRPQCTGRLIVAFDDACIVNGHDTFFYNKIGLSVAHSSDFISSMPHDDELDGVDVFIYDEFGVALVSCESDEQLYRLKQHAMTRMIIQPERVVYIPAYLPVGHNSTVAWGIRSTRSDLTKYTGKGVKIAILDSGFDMQHPDFSGRTIIPQNFVYPNAPADVQDTHGHGTHCVGIACGNTDERGMRYGIAGDADIYVGKVLDDSERCPQKTLLDAITWAAREKCHVISISLVSQIPASTGFDISYERAAQYAMSQGCIVIAAAGNESKRSKQVYRPVSSPANCPSIIAVGALDKNLDIADFSNRGINSGFSGGAVDIAAPGVNIYSSWPGGIRYRSVSGTSMATPHVAGILALLWEQNPDATPDQIINLLYSRAQKLTYNVIDVGAGLSIAT